MNISSALSLFSTQQVSAATDDDAKKKKDAAAAAADTAQQDSFGPAVQVELSPEAKAILAIKASEQRMNVTSSGIAGALMDDQQASGDAQMFSSGASTGVSGASATQLADLLRKAGMSQEDLDKTLAKLLPDTSDEAAGGAVQVSL